MTKPPNLDISQRKCPRDVENMLAIFPTSRLTVRSATSGAASLAWEDHVDKQHCKIEYHSTERTFSFKFQERRSSAKIHHLCRVNANSSNCSLEVFFSSKQLLLFVFNTLFGHSCYMLRYVTRSSCYWRVVSATIRSVRYDPLIPGWLHVRRHQTKWDEHVAIKLMGHYPYVWGQRSTTGVYHTCIALGVYHDTEHLAFFWNEISLYQEQHLNWQ